MKLRGVVVSNRTQVLSTRLCQRLQGLQHFQRQTLSVSNSLGVPGIRTGRRGDAFFRNRELPLASLDLRVRFDNLARLRDELLLFGQLGTTRKTFCDEFLFPLTRRQFLPMPTAESVPKLPASFFAELISESDIRPAHAIGLREDNPLAGCAGCGNTERQ